MRLENKYTKAINEAYVRLYAASEPSADFNQLKKNAPWVDKNKNVKYQANEISDEQAIQEGLLKFIDYEKYLIDIKTYSEIMDDICKKYHFSKRTCGDFRIYVALFGPSPSFKTDTDNDDG